MDKIYSTTQIASIFNLHPNTIRLYEEWGVISKPARNSSGYRLFTDEHVKQVRIVRIALRAEVVQNGLRRQAVEILMSVAKRDNKKAIELAEKYLENIVGEIKLCEEAIAITECILSGKDENISEITLTRKHAADSLNITIDTLRNWEMNGLLKAKRRQNGYRIYDQSDIKMLKIIRQLRLANYSLSAILRMVNALGKQNSIDIEKVLNTPVVGEHVITACDKLTVSLRKLKADAELIINKIIEM